MTARLVRVRPDTYADSVLLMKAARAMQGQEGVDWASAAMGTSANLGVVAAEGFDDTALSDVAPNDLVLALRADSEEAAASALDAGEAALSTQTAAEKPVGERRPRTMQEAVGSLPGANVALVSVPGGYAAMETHKALSAGLHVLLFSDNVSLAQEVELKSRANELGLLVMGPGAGTASLGGVGLGFANAIRPGSVGVIAAAGTGAQEVMTLLHRWGAGVADAVGVGGRDLSETVGGRMTWMAMRAMEADPRIDVLLLVSKPPSATVAAELLGALGAKPTVVAFIGLDEEIEVPDGVQVARTLEEAALLTVKVLGIAAPDPSQDLHELVAAAISNMPQERNTVRGLFSGGTLCYEAMVVISSRLGAVHSNVPLRDGWDLPGPPGSHVCLDLGEEEFTRGRPHPMIDPEARSELIRQHGEDPTTAVILLDVVLGYGAHEDPASVLAPPCADVVAGPSAPAVVAYVLGTDDDPQDLQRQRRQLEEAGCLLAPTGARAALMAAAVAARRPDYVKERP